MWTCRALGPDGQLDLEALDVTGEDWFDWRRMTGPGIAGNDERSA